VEKFEEECWFILPAFALSFKDGFAIAGGWLKWHIEIKWPNAEVSGRRAHAPENTTGANGGSLH